MALLNTADAIYVGANAADKVYLGSNLVWEKPPVGAITAPVYRSSASTDYASNADSLSIAKPAGTIDGDIMLAVLFTGRGGPEIIDLTAPAGWTAVAAASAVSSSGFYGRFRVFWKRASGEGSSYTFTHTGQTQSDEGVILTYSGCVASGDPIDAFSTNTGTGSVATALAIATTQANDMIVVAGHNWDILGGTAIPGGVERFDHLCTASDAVRATAGTTGDLTYTSGSGGVRPWSSWAMALKGIGGGGDGPGEWLVTSFTPGGERWDFNGEVGIRIQPAVDKAYQWIGLNASVDNTGLHRVNLYDWNTQTLLRSADVDMTGVSLHGWGWASIEPITLTAGTFYALVKEVVQYESWWWDMGPTVLNPAFVSNVMSCYRGGGAFNANGDDLQYVGLNLGWGGAAPPFAPTDIAGCTIWLDASQLTLANDEVMTAWPNLVPGGPANSLYDVAPFSVCKTNARNGLRVVRCFATGSRWRLYTTGVTFDYTVIYVSRRLSAGRVVGAILDTGGNKLIGYWQDYEDVCYAGGFYGPQNAATGAWRLYSDDCDSVTLIPRLFTNGILIGTGGAVAQGWAESFAISGYAAYTDAETCDCEVAEVLLYNRKLTDEERQQVEGYLRTKWGNT